MQITEVKKMEAAFLEAKEKAKTELLNEVKAKLTQLAELGFKYELAGERRAGRPRKEVAGGLVQQAKA